MSEPVRKKFAPTTEIIPFPVERIDKSNLTKFYGKFNGICVEIEDADSIRQLYNCGCFGISSAHDRTAPSVLKNKSFRKLSNTQLKRLYELKQIFPDEFYDEEETIELIEKVEMTENNEGGGEEDQRIRKIPFKLKESLVLSMLEAFFLHYSLKCLTVKDFSGRVMDTDELWTTFMRKSKHFPQQFVVYNFYRAKNWVVKSGLKFGTDFLLYKHGPRFYHGSFLVYIRTDTNIAILDLQQLYRIAETSAKEIILVDVHKPTTSNENLLSQIKEFRVTEILPKRFTFLQERDQ